MNAVNLRIAGEIIPLKLLHDRMLDVTVPAGSQQHGHFPFTVEISAALIFVIMSLDFQCRGTSQK